VSVEILQRLRIVFAQCAEVKYISHLDLMRVWQRALRRANVPLAYSHGFNPRPKLSFASALPVGFTGRAEVLDVMLERRMTPRQFVSCLQKELPAGLHLVSAEEVPSASRPLSTQVIAAEYEVFVESADAPEVMQERLHNLLAAETISRRRERPGKVQVYDLRPLIRQLWIAGRQGDTYVLGMRLQADEQGTGRPDEVMAALDMAVAVRGIERLQILFKHG
jgi:radical SAM-linked protein